ncbi:MAG: hypothetical protein IPK99_03645 [Flavobacteriales bacterium]|nr:hypothetical protein [Flavobacteriales bacterium]
MGGTPDLGGSWTDPNGNAHSGTFTPGVDIAGVYTYTVTGTAPCPNAAASATVTVVNLPDPGTRFAHTMHLRCTDRPLRTIGRHPGCRWIMDGSERQRT